MVDHLLLRAWAFGAEMIRLYPFESFIALFLFFTWLFWLYEFRARQRWDSHLVRRQ